MYYWLKNLLHAIFIGKPRNKSDIVWRFTLSDEGAEAVKDLMKTCHADNRSEVIDTALTLFQKQVAMKEAGAKIGYWYEDEEGNRVYHEFGDKLLMQVKAK